MLRYCDNCKKEFSCVAKDKVTNWCVCNNCKREAIKFGIRAEHDFENLIQQTDEIQCPHCEFIHINWFDYIEPADQEGDFQMICESCEKEFNVMFKTTVWVTSFR